MGIKNRNFKRRVIDMITDKLMGIFSSDMAIDLGTANTLVYLMRKGIVLYEPSVVAMEYNGRKRVLAVGLEAKTMLGRTPAGISALRPLKDGVISDLDVAEAMLREFVNKVHNRRAFRAPRIVICIPSGITEVEKRAVRDSAVNAGAREVFLIEEPMAAAIGAGLPVMEPGGKLIVDVGGGTTEVAVISLGAIVVCETVRVAGDEMDEAIINYVKKHYDLLIGERTAEEIKINIGSAIPLDEEETMEMKGRSLKTGLPKKMTISSKEVREAIEEPVRTIVDTVKATLERTPPELAADIVDSGMILTGGGSMLKGLDRLLASETGLPVRCSEDPITTVVEGAGRALEDFNLLKKIAVSAVHGL